MSVCLSDDNFRKPWRRKFSFAHPMYLRGTRVKFIYEGHWLKVKVTGVKSRKSLFPQCKTSIDHNSGSIKDRGTRFACIMGFSAMTDRMVWPPSLLSGQMMPTWDQTTGCCRSTRVCHIEGAVANGKTRRMNDENRRRRRPQTSSRVCCATNATGCDIDWLIDWGLTSHQTHYRSYRGQVFTGQMTQPTVSTHWRNTQN